MRVFDSLSEQIKKCLKTNRTEFYSVLDASCWWCNKHCLSVSARQLSKLSCHPFSAVPPAPCGEATAPQQGCPYQGHRTAETSTEPHMKFTMWNTCTRKDTEKEEKREYAYTNQRITWTWKHLPTNPQRRMSVPLSQYNNTSEAKSMSTFSPFLQY